MPVNRRPAKIRPDARPPGATVLIRGGPDTLKGLRDAAALSAVKYEHEGAPLLGISVFAALSGTVSDTIRSHPRLLASEYVYCPTVDQLSDFRLLPTFTDPGHFDVWLRRGDDEEITSLLTALGDPMPNPVYPGDVSRDRSRREEPG